ncbi:oxygenase [Longimycelium tulufanense]|uniref:Oxygenase n=1 Tax=Longimycelium tulufanense TaxID=907463 RepID=A0A8J3CFG4_9PSEU|nr:FAD-dependent monooxygenase [Longimycelium tulufanense]GGM58696.1 oxygenase [Longimycelium tulufanense]
MDDDVPVLVVGGGPVGLTTGLLLARAGVPNLVLEAEPRRLAIGSRSICVQRDVLDVLERVGLGRRIVDHGVTWYRGRTFFREHEVLTISFPESSHSAFPPFTNIPQTDVELLLDEQAAAEDVVDVRYGHRVVGTEQDDTGVTVRVSTVDGEREFRGSHCVAADGPHSTVRHLLGLPFTGESYPDQFLIADIRADLGFAAERRFFFDPVWNPGRQVLVHPQPGGVWRIDWQVPADFDLDRAQADGTLDRRVRAIVGDRDYDLVWVSVYRFHQRRVPSFRVGRVLLAGDAAHVMSPFGARGLNSGIQDAENAAWKIAYDRAGWAGPALLASYDAERGAAADENLRVTGQTMRFLVPQTDSDRTHRHDVLTRSVEDPAVRPEIDSGKLAEPFWYLDSPLTTPAPADQCAAFPREPGATRPPLPGVLCPDATLPGGWRLRQTFGPHFTVLVRDDEPELPVPDHPPVRVVRLPADGLAAELGLCAGTCGLVRPDGHLAAIGPTSALTDALKRANGW